MRRQVALLAALSAIVPALLLGAALLPVLVPRPGPPSRAPIYIALALLAGVGVARGVLVRRLVAPEQAVIRFWAFSPMLALLTACEPPRYSGRVAPLPPKSFGKSLNFGSPSFTASTFSP